MDERAIFDEPPVLGFQRNGSYPSDSSIDISKPSKKNWLRRLYVTLRRLVRKRQESAAMREMASTCNRAINVEAAGARSLILEARKHEEEVKDKAAKEIAVMAKRIANRDAALDEMRQKMTRQQADFDYAITQKTNDIKELHDVEIPKLKRELSVANTHIEYLEKIIEKMHVHEERQIAVDNQRIVEAENPSNESQIRQILKGER